MADKKEDPCRLVTGEFRVSFPAVFEARQFDKDTKPKFELTMLFKKKKDGTESDDVKAIRRILRRAIIAKWGEDKAKWPKNLKLPIHDGDEKDDLEGYKGHHSVIAKNQHRPGVLDRNKNPITKEDGAFYAGCYARANVRAFTYGGKPSKIAPGVGLSLDFVQKLRDGESFSGGPSVEDAFDDLEDSDDDDFESDGGEDFEDSE